MNQNTKTLITFGAFTLTLIASLIAQANIPVPPLPPEGQANILSAMYDTILHNPSSMFVLIILCIAAWLMDELPFINSKFVTHFTTLIGGSIYWMFCHPANVPKSFPYAWPVLACIGCMCGFVAGLLHKTAIGRLIEYVKGKIPGSDPKPADQNPTSRLPAILLCGFLSFGLMTCALSGCAGGPQRKAVNTLATVQTVTVGAYDAYVAEVVAGRAPTNDLPRVSQRFNQFQAAFRVALDGVQFNTNALAPPNVNTLSGDLLNLITTLTPKPQ